MDARTLFNVAGPFATGLWIHGGESHRLCTISAPPAGGRVTPRLGQDVAGASRGGSSRGHRVLLLGVPAAAPKGRGQELKLRLSRGDVPCYSECGKTLAAVQARSGSDIGDVSHHRVSSWRVRARDVFTSLASAGPRCPPTQKQPLSPEAGPADRKRNTRVHTCFYGCDLHGVRDQSLSGTSLRRH